MKKLSYLFTANAIVLSDIMCFVVAYTYRDILCSIEHAGYSAPASTALFYAIPFMVGIIVCAGLAIRFRKKQVNSNLLNDQFTTFVNFNKILV